MTETLAASLPVSSNSRSELEEAVSRIQELTQMALDMTVSAGELIACPEPAQKATLVAQAVGMAKASLDLQALLQEAIANAPAQVEPPEFKWVEKPAPTPNDMDRAHPAGTNDNVSHHIVLVGRAPGIYTEADKATKTTERVPNGSRFKRATRAEALTFYRARYDAGEVHRMVCVPVAEVNAQAAGSTSESARRHYHVHIPVPATSCQVSVRPDGFKVDVA
ncbi:hypothetical protein FB45DRAFT_1091419 [Roridomyces roridus]|uniref:Uncharacterized protein n=1 Tax=Roridomyces roridus TaxID=1738132 RepID=A0AAD7BIY5_9AGAR|nr:hypothetical protein FB45DRAFT_1091419 [Roridomyces roridus]